MTRRDEDVKEEKETEEQKRMAKNETSTDIMVETRNGDQTSQPLHAMKAWIGHHGHHGILYEGTQYDGRDIGYGMKARTKTGHNGRDTS